MIYTQLLQVIAASCLLTLALTLFLSRTHQRVTQWFQRHLPPRYLKPYGVRRRASAAVVEREPMVTVQSELHEPS